MASEAEEWLAAALEGPATSSAVAAMGALARQQHVARYVGRGARASTHHQRRAIIHAMATRGLAPTDYILLHHWGSPEEPTEQWLHGTTLAQLRDRLTPHGLRASSVLLAADWARTAAGYITHHELGDALQPLLKPRGKGVKRPATDLAGPARVTKSPAWRTSPAHHNLPATQPPPLP